MSAVSDFHADPTPEKAVALAIADHMAGPLIDWPYIDALRKAEEKLRAEQNAVATLKLIVADLPKKRDWLNPDVEGAARDIIRIAGAS